MLCLCSVSVLVSMSVFVFVRSKVLTAHAFIDVLSSLFVQNFQFFNKSLIALAQLTNDLQLKLLFSLI